MTDEAQGPSYGFDTLQVHAGSRPDPATGARQTPIYQTTAYVFRDAEHAAALFNLQEVGFIYSRLTNPTVAVLQERIATLEGGAGAVCCSSGHAAQILALFPLMAPGCNVVVSTRLYGGTVTQMSQTIRRFGWSAKFVDTDDLDSVRAAIDDDTRALFCELIANPGGYISDIPALAAIADEAGLPLIVDNTSATPYLCRPIELGATLVVHSTTKYLTGNGTVTGGAIVDSGTFDWSASGKFPSLSEPEPAYHGLKFHETFGPLAFTFNGIAVGLRDLGMTMNPQAAHYTLLGIETLSLRMAKHCENAVKVASWLEHDPRIDHVTYAGLEFESVPPPHGHRLPQGRKLDLHLRRQGRLRRLREADRCRRDLQSCRQPRRHAISDHPLRFDDAPAIVGGAAARGGCRPQCRASFDRDRGCRRPDRRSRSGPGEGGGLRFSRRSRTQR